MMKFWPVYTLVADVCFHEMHLNDDGGGEGMGGGGDPSRVLRSPPLPPPPTPPIEQVNGRSPSLTAVVMVRSLDHTRLTAYSNVT